MILKNLSYPQTFTSDQINTLNSVKQIDERGLLYEINYTADYKLDEVLSYSDNAYDANKSVTEILIPNSGYKLDFSVDNYGCLGFCTKNNENSVILGRNYDFFDHDHPCCICKTNSKSGYSYIGALDLFFFGIRENNLNEIDKRIQLLYTPFQIQDGINEKGFVCAILMLMEGRTVQKRGKQPILSTFVVNLLLSKAANVNEACEILDQYDMTAFFQGNDYNHKWIMCDKSGDMAVIEYVNNEMKIIRTDNEKIATANYYMSHPIQGHMGRGYLRVSTINHFLNICPNPSDETAMKMLKNIRQSLCQDSVDNQILSSPIPQAGITYWSEIFNTKKLTMDFVINENYDKIYSFSL